METSNATGTWICVVIHDEHFKICKTNSSIKIKIQRNRNNCKLCVIPKRGWLRRQDVKQRDTVLDRPDVGLRIHGPSRCGQADNSPGHRRDLGTGDMLYDTTIPSLDYCQLHHVVQLLYHNQTIHTSYTIQHKKFSYSTDSARRLP